MFSGALVSVIAAVNWVSTTREDNMAERLEGKVALITGAARGQGRSHATTLAQAGADIIALDICKQIESNPYPLSTPADLAETASAVEALGRNILTVEVDVRKCEEIATGRSRRP